MPAISPSPRVAILYYPAKTGAAALAAGLAADLPRWGAASAEVFSLAEIDTPRLSGFTLAIPVGGDGTILGAARLCAPLGLPLLPVQQGRLGLLADLELAAAEHDLPAYLSGDCDRDARLMLQAELDGVTGSAVVALNDIVATRGVSSGPVRLDVELGEIHFTTLWADGLIVASPTGSTAYTRSAGGPIIHPTVEALSLTAVAPQSGPAQILVAPPDERITVRVTTDAPQWVCLADGLVHAQPSSGARLTVRRAAYDAILLRRGNRYRQQRRLRDLLVGDPRPGL